MALENVSVGTEPNSPGVILPFLFQVPCCEGANFHLVVLTFHRLCPVYTIGKEGTR